MVTVSHEVPAQTEARLRGVFRRSEVDWLPGLWAFVEDDQASGRGDSIAVIRDGGRLSALCPAGADTERFGVFRVVLPRGADDSGFVGWLASRVKARTGSGLFVVCGHNRARGGIFDFYGIPEAETGGVRALLDRTCTADSLDGVVMRVVATAAGAGIGIGTVFCFEQVGDSISARYGGGRVVQGWLAGTVDSGASGLRFDYLQVDVAGRVDSGQSTGTLDRLPDGRRRLTEHFIWASRDGSGANRLEEL